MPASDDDTWLLPTRQADHPARPQVREARLHSRREATFLALASTFILASCALVMLGARVLDLDAVVARLAPEVELPLAMLLPIGVLVLPLTFVVTAIVCELYGRRRAVALVLAGSLATLASLGLAHATAETDVLAPSLALATCYVVAQLVHVLLFEAFRRRTGNRHFWLRLDLAAMFAQLAGWAAYAYLLRNTAPEFGDLVIRSLALGACAYTTLAVFVATLPAVAITKLLAIYLRIDADVPEEVVERSPAASTTSRIRIPLPAPIPVEEAPAPPPRRAPNEYIRAYTSAEMRFFTEGDELTEAAES